MLNQLQTHVEQISTKVSHLDIIQANVDGIATEMQTMRQESRVINSTVTATFTRIEEVEQFVAQINTQTSQLTALCTKMVEDKASPSPDSIWDALPDGGYGRQTDSRALGGVSGTGSWRIDTGCDMMCACSCHKGDKGIFTLQGLLVGSVSAAVSGYPLFKPTCTQKSCRGPKSLEFTVTYRFPRWFWKKACYIRLVNNRNLHSGIQPIFRMKNQLPHNSETLAACQMGNIERLRQLFESRMATPHDEDPSGRTLIAVCIYYSLSTRVS